MQGVKEALRNNEPHPQFGLSGVMLQEYFVELQKKENLLRQSYARASAKIPGVADPPQSELPIKEEIPEEEVSESDEETVVQPMKRRTRARGGKKRPGLDLRRKLAADKAARTMHE